MRKYFQENDLIASNVMSAFGTKRTWRSHSPMSAFGGEADMGLCLPLTHAASVDCPLYFINRGLRRQGIGSRSNRHAVFAVPNEDFER
jgi:hypothetical protein